MYSSARRRRNVIGQYAINNICVYRRAEYAATLARNYINIIGRYARKVAAKRAVPDLSGASRRVNTAANVCDVIDHVAIQHIRRPA